MEMMHSTGAETTPTTAYTAPGLFTAHSPCWLLLLRGFWDLSTSDEVKEMTGREIKSDWIAVGYSECNKELVEIGEACADEAKHAARIKIQDPNSMNQAEVIESVHS